MDSLAQDLAELEVTLLDQPRTEWNRGLSKHDLLSVIYDNNCSNSSGVLQNYIASEKLGEGTYGVVFKAQHRITGEVVALKRIRFESVDEGTPSTAIREVAILRLLKHPNIVNLLEIAHDEKSMILVFEYMDNDLHNYIDAQQNNLDQATICSFLYQLLTGLSFCHGLRIYHRDLKPQNLLINFQGELKLADFGLARSGSLPINAFTHEVVTLWYRPPDVILGNTKYTEAIDMWGVGCIFAEMYLGRPLVPGANPYDQLLRTFRACGGPNHSSNVIWDPTRYSLWPDYEQRLLTDPKGRECLISYPLLRQMVKRMSNVAYDLLVRFLHYDEPSRITCDEALKHPYFTVLQENPEQAEQEGYLYGINHHQLNGHGTQYYPGQQFQQNPAITDPSIPILTPADLGYPHNPYALYDYNKDVDDFDAFMMAQDAFGSELDQLQEEFDATSRSLEARRALGRAPREYYTLLQYESQIRGRWNKEMPYQQFLFDQSDFDFSGRLRPEDFIVQYSNESLGFQEVSFVELLQDNVITTHLQHLHDYATKYPTISGMVTGCGDYIPIHGDNEENVADNQVAMSPFQVFQGNEDLYKMQLAHEYEWIETNWQTYRQRMDGADRVFRDLLVGLVGKAHAAVQLNPFQGTAYIPQFWELPHHIVITEDQLQWLLCQHTHGTYLKNLWVNQQIGNVNMIATTGNIPARNEECYERHRKYCDVMHQRYYQQREVYQQENEVMFERVQEYMTAKNALTAAYYTLLNSPNATSQDQQRLAEQTREQFVRFKELQKQIDEVIFDRRQDTSKMTEEGRNDLAANRNYDIAMYETFKKQVSQFPPLPPNYDGIKQPYRATGREQQQVRQQQLFAQHLNKDALQQPGSHLLSAARAMAGQQPNRGAVQHYQLLNGPLNNGLPIQQQINNLRYDENGAPLPLSAQSSIQSSAASQQQQQQMGAYQYQSHSSHPNGHPGQRPMETTQLQTHRQVVQEQAQQLTNAVYQPIVAAPPNLQQQTIPQLLQPQGQHPTAIAPGIPSQDLEAHVVRQNGQLVFRYTIEQLAQLETYKLQDHPLLMQQAQRLLPQQYYETLVNQLAIPIGAKDFKELIQYINTLSSANPLAQ